MRLTIEHTTRYGFEAEVPYGLLQVRKTPKTSSPQAIVAWETAVEGGVKESEFTDHHGNQVELFSYQWNTDAVAVRSAGTVDVTDTQGVVGPGKTRAPTWLYLWHTPRTTARAGVRALMRDAEGEDMLARFHALSSVIRDAVSYKVGASEPDWTAEQAIEAGAGVCQDHTHIFLACARAWDVPARYVSGYLMLNDTTVQDAMHAWAEVFLDGLGWVGFDVSNGISPDARYVRVATGLDYGDAAPVIGTRVGGGTETLDVSIRVAEQQ